MLSTATAMSLEEVTGRAAEARWFQLYFFTRDRGQIADLVGRAAVAGFGALCVTGDVPVMTERWRDLRHAAAGRVTSVAHMPEGDMGEFEILSERLTMRFPVGVSDPGLTWKDVEWLRSISDLPVLVKGVMTAEDARIAMESGIAGVVVSNHGGRIADHLQASIEALPEVVEAVAGRGLVLFDGGVRRPTDVAIALALGADAVGIGRPVWWALAYGGSLGVASYLRGLVFGLARAMALAGVQSIDQLTPARVGRRPSM
jgi:isopentenyl diphosphate isomerase/L-lactate dehydrogenase-like FMN-dependent dehydrogenase